MNSLFSGCNQLTSIDISHFNTENVQDMQFMFNNCSQLTSAYLYTDDSVYNFGSFPRYCFSGCSSLSYVKIGSAIWGYGMFDGCDSLDTIDFQGTMQEWNTNVAARSSGWNSGSSVTTIHCTDGDITL